MGPVFLLQVADCGANLCVPSPSLAVCWLFASNVHWTCGDEGLPCGLRPRSSKDSGARDEKWTKGSASKATAEAPLEAGRCCKGRKDCDKIQESPVIDEASKRQN